MDLAAVRSEFADIKERTQGVRSLLLVTDDGFPLASTLDAGEEEVRSTAVGAILTDAGARALSEMDLGNLDVVVALGETGYFVLKRLDENATIMAVCGRDVQLGLVLARVRSAFPRILEAYGRE